MNNVEPPPQKSSSTQQTINQKQVCYRCGCDGHWSRTCYTPKHLVEAYQIMEKDKIGRLLKVNHIIFVCLNQICMTLNVDNDDFLKVDLEDFGDNE